MNGARYNLSDLNGVFMFQQFKERNGHPKKKSPHIIQSSNENVDSCSRIRYHLEIPIHSPNATTMMTTRWKWKKKVMSSSQPRGERRYIQRRSRSFTWLYSRERERPVYHESVTIYSTESNYCTYILCPEGNYLVIIDQTSNTSHRVRVQRYFLL